jgi:hypothetical protein
MEAMLRAVQDYSAHAGGRGTLLWWPTQANPSEVLSISDSPKFVGGTLWAGIPVLDASRSLTPTRSTLPDGGRSRWCSLSESPIPRTPAGVSTVLPAETSLAISAAKRVRPGPVLRGLPGLTGPAGAEATGARTRRK